MSKKAIVFDICHFRNEDGPKIRTIIFLKAALCDVSGVVIHSAFPKSLSLLSILTAVSVVVTVSQRAQMVSIKL